MCWRKRSRSGTYEVTIRAEVQIADLVNDLDRFKKILSWQKNPRIAVIVRRDLPRSAWPRPQDVRPLGGQVKEDGFSVFNLEDAHDIRMGLLVGLNLEISSKPTKFQDLDLTLNEIGLSAHIYRPGDGEIIGTASAVKALPGENRLQALDKAHGSAWRMSGGSCAGN